MTAISRLTRAASETQRVERGENRIPAVWRARVVYVRESTADCGHRPGVYVTVPNFTRGEIHGPVQVVGDTPAEGDMVVAVAVEGRKNDWIIITPTGLAELESRLGEVEGALVDLDDRLTSTHGENAHSIGILETQMGVLDAMVEAHQLAEITWWSSPSGSRSFSIPDFDPSQRSVSALRLIVDVVTDGLEGVSGITVTCGSATRTVSLRSAGDSHRYAMALDFPSGDPSGMTITVSGTGTAGRLGITRPRLVTPVEGSA